MPVIAKGDAFAITGFFVLEKICHERKSPGLVIF